MFSEVNNLTPQLKSIVSLRHAQYFTETLPSSLAGTSGSGGGCSASAGCPSAGCPSTTASVPSAGFSPSTGAFSPGGAPSTGAPSTGGAPSAPVLKHIILFSNKYISYTDTHDEKL